MGDESVNSAPALDLFIDLPAGRGRAPALARGLREAILIERLPVGTRLPPYRTLAADLGLSRSVVAAVYTELVEEGWLEARQGSGTYVARRVAPSARSRPTVSPLPPWLDLRQGMPAPDLFPRQAWTRATRTVMANYPHSLFLPPDPQGLPELRSALAEYCARTRGVLCSPEQVIITAGYAGALRLIAAATPRAAHFVERVSLPFHAAILRDHTGVKPNCLDVDVEGACPPPHEFPKRQTVVHLTPAHHFPLGYPLSPDRRHRFLDLLDREHSWIVEDDYDGEFRYDRRPVGALQALAPHRVIYCGSASKSLSPSLRIGWLVAPDSLRERLVSLKGEREQHVSMITQATLAELLTTGAYDRAVRTARRTYRTRRSELEAALRPRLAGSWQVAGMPAGLHLTLTGATDEVQTLRSKLEARRITVDYLQAYAITGPRPGVVLGYARPTRTQWPAALAQLVAAVESG